MSEILNSAKKLEQKSKEQSESIETTLNNGLQTLETHLAKRIKQSASTTVTAIKDHNQKNQQALEKASIKALPIFTIGLITGAALAVGVILAIQKLNIQL